LDGCFGCFGCGAVSGDCIFILVGSRGLVVVGDGVLIAVGCICILIGLVSALSTCCYFFWVICCVGAVVLFFSWGFVLLVRSGL